MIIDIAGANRPEEMEDICVVAPLSIPCHFLSALRLGERLLSGFLPLGDLWEAIAVARRSHLLSMCHAESLVDHAQRRCYKNQRSPHNTWIDGPHSTTMLSSFSSHVGHSTC